MFSAIEKRKYKWLTVFLVYNNELYDAGHEDDKSYITMEDQKNSLFNSVKHTTYCEEIKIIIVEVRIGQRSFGIEQKVHVVERVKNGFQQIPPPANLRRDVLVGEESIVETMDYLVKNYLAERHMAITFGHGSIFGINMVPAPQRPIISRPSEVKWAGGKKYVITAPFVEDYWYIDTIKYSYSDGDDNFIAEDLTDFDKLATVFKKKKINILGNTDLRKALARIFPDKKLDILVMYNCLMQNIFSQYEFRKNVDFFVAPESGICYPGYNWMDVFTQMAYNYDADTKDVAKLFLYTIRQERDHSFHPNFRVDVEQTWKINAVKLDEEIYDEIKEEFKNIVKAIYDISNTSKDIFKYLQFAGRQVFNYGNYCLPDVKMVDLFVFVSYLPTAFTVFKVDNPLTIELQKLKNLLTSIESYSFTGKYFYNSEFSYVDVDYIDYPKGFGFWFAEKKIESDLLMGVLKPADQCNVARNDIPSFIAGTEYGNLFNRYMLWNTPVF